MTDRAFQKALLWLFWAANLFGVAIFWAFGSGAQMIAGTLDSWLGFARLAGLLATFAALTQFVLMGRAGWLEPVFGMDRIARAHRLNGYAAIILMLVHAIMMLGFYAPQLGVSVLEFLLAPPLPYVLLAEISLLLFLIMVGTTIYIVRRHLRFETWYFVHLLAYAAISLVPFHQLVVGGDFAANPVATIYWLALYAFAGSTILIWRFGRPLYRFLKFRFEVERVVPAAPRATSVYITGKQFERFTARGGQFVLVRFLTPGRWWQEHPFSLSMLPSKQHLRLTIRQLGDFTNTIPNLKPGTKVIVSGPHGAFTRDLALKNKALYIAGGIGITPIRSLLEEQAATSQPRDSVMLYGNRNEAEIIFKDELAALGQKLDMPIHHVLSDDPTAHEKGFIDQEKIKRLVPDVSERDIYLCGPPPMMAGVRKALLALGVPKVQIHFERFELHVR